MSEIKKINDKFKFIKINNIAFVMLKSDNQLIIMVAYIKLIQPINFFLFFEGKNC